MGLESILIEFGGRTLAKIIGNKLGPQGQVLIDEALGYLGEVFGAEPTPAAIEAKIEASRQTAAPKIAIAEGRAVELVLAQVKIMEAGNEQQKLTNELLREAMSKGPLWTWAWLYVWQYVLMFFWFWTLIAVHLANAAMRLSGGNAMPAPSVTDLLALTGAYLALHMGGHTVLELMRGKWGRSAEAGAE